MHEVIESPDGDPAKVGTITDAVPIHCSPMTLTPAPEGHPAWESGSALLVARPPSNLVLAPIDFDPRRMSDGQLRRLLK